MIGLIFIIAILLTVIVALKSKTATWKKIVGGILLFSATMCIGVGFSGGGLPLIVHILLALTLTMLGVQLTFPFRKIQISALVIVVVSTLTYQPIKDRADKKRAEEHFNYERFRTTKNVRVNIEGTEWTYMDEFSGTGDYWHRLQFKDGKVYHYEVFPSKGNWGEPTVSSYSIVEGRYGNTGQKYIGIEWEESLDSKWTFVPKDEQLGVTYGGRPIILKMNEGYRNWPD